MEKIPHHTKVAENLIKQIEEGTAPWQKPWRPGQSGMMPVNPITNKRYKGINALHLMTQGYSDPRWLTYNQAQSIDAQVRKGEKGTTVQYWKFAEEREKLDPAGNVVLDGEGKAVKELVKLDSPRVFYATVFNASQVDNMPELPVVQRDRWADLKRAEHILNASGANIRHEDQNRAYYRPSTDTIHLPQKEQFDNAANYYATALHEVGHWTGHSSRLQRDLTNPFGSEAYAKEELRAEIASMVLGDELGIGHDPGQHAAYVKSWVKVLKDDPMEIFRAAADAEKIVTFVMAFEQQQEIEQTAVFDDQYLTVNQMQKLNINTVMTIDEFLATHIHKEAVKQRDAMIGDWPGFAENMGEELKAFAKREGFEARYQFVDPESASVHIVKIEYSANRVVAPFASYINVQDGLAYTAFEGEGHDDLYTGDLAGQVDLLGDAIDRFKEQRPEVLINSDLHQANLNEFLGDGADPMRRAEAVDTWNRIARTATDLNVSPVVQKGDNDSLSVVYLSDAGILPVETKLAGQNAGESYLDDQRSESLALALSAALDQPNKVMKQVQSVMPTLQQITADEAIFDGERAGDWVVRDHTGLDITPSFREFDAAKAEFDAITEGASALLLLQQNLIAESQFTKSFFEHTGVTIKEPKEWTGMVRYDLIKEKEDGSMSIVSPGEATGAGLFAHKLDGGSELIGQYTSSAQAEHVAIRLKQVTTLVETMQSKISQIQPIAEKAVEVQMQQQQNPIKSSAHLKQQPGITLINVPYKEKSQAKELGAKWSGQKQSWYVPEGVNLEPFKKWMPDPKLAESKIAEQADAANKVYIAVPYAERNEAKKAGAKWDGDNKSWYVPEGVDLTPFRKFMTDQAQPSQKMPALSPKEDLAAALRDIGAIVDNPEDLVLSPSGTRGQNSKETRLRAKDDKPGEYSIFYRAFDSNGQAGDVPAGFMQNNRTGESARWVYKGQHVSAEDKAVAHARAAEMRQKRDQETAKQYKDMASHLLEFFSVCPPATNQEAYLVNKGVDGNQLRVVPESVQLSEGSPIKVGRNFKHSKELREADPKAVVFTAGELLIPAHDTKNELWSVQAVQANGSKRFATGGKKTGNYLALNNLASADAIVIGEGYATVKSLEKIDTGASIGFVSAFDSGNLLPVAAAIRDQYPGTPIIFAGDDDHHQTLKEIPKPNAGREKATAAAAAVENSTAFFPVFGPGELESGLTDFNDLEKKSSLGIDGLARQFQFAVDAALVKARQIAEKKEQTQVEKLQQTNQQRLNHNRSMARSM